MLFGEVREAGLAREKPGLPTERLGLYSGNGGVSSNLGSLLYPTPPFPLQAHGPHQCHACQCSSTVGFIIATCLFCSARSFLVPASWSARWKSAWARVPFPDTCCFQAQKVSHCCLVSCAPFFPIHRGLSPQPVSWLPSTAVQTPPQLPLMCPCWLTSSDP